MSTERTGTPAADTERDHVADLALSVVRGARVAPQAGEERAEACNDLEAVIIKVRNGDWQGLGALAASKASPPRKAGKS